MSLLTGWILLQAELATVQPDTGFDAIGAAVGSVCWARDGTIHEPRGRFSYIVWRKGRAYFHSVHSKPGRRYIALLLKGELPDRCHYS